MSTTMRSILVNFYWIFGSCVFMILVRTIVHRTFTYIRQMRRMTPLLNSLDHLPTKPIIGSLYYLIKDTKDFMTERGEKVIELISKYESAIFWMMHVPIVSLGKHEDIQAVLNNSRCSRKFLRLLEGTLGDSIFVLHGEKWRRSRKILLAAFSPNRFHRFFSIIKEYSSFTTKALELFCDTDEIIDIKHYILSLNANSFVRNISDYEINKSNNEDIAMINAVIEIARLECTRFLIPWLHPKFIYKTYLFFLGKLHLYREILQLPKKIIKERSMCNMTRNLQNDKIAEDTDTASPELFIDMLLQRHNGDADFTEKHIRAEIFSVISAGYETTAATVCNVLLMLAMHLEVQEKVYDEIKTVFGNDDREVQIEDVKKLVYMEQCINETLRKFAVIPSTLRVHNEDIMLSDGHIIPAGCLIFLGFYLSHHDKTFFPNADNWDPERFSPERYGDCKNAFLPFGGGPRLCIGTKYAMASIKTQLVHLIRRYHFSTEMKMQDIHLVLDILLRNDSGYWLKLHSRPKN
uniref:Cytochrome P450 3638G3 n=1 Tax=Maconellicoccus hirsutus TaxID=177089 RepID=A0AAT9UTM9_MACHI